METPQPSLKRGRDYWDQVNMPESEFKGRVQKIRQEMKKKNIDVLLVYGRTTNEYANPCYVSNYITGTQRAAMVVLSPKDEIALIFDGFPRGLPTAKSRTWIQNVIASGDVPKSTLQYLTEKKLIPSTFGFAGVSHMMTFGQLKNLKEGLANCKIVDCDQILTDMRLIKSQRECDQIQRASRIIMQAFDSVVSGPKSKVNERSLTSDLERITYLEGAEDVRLMIARPQKKDWSLRPIEESQISSGDTVILYLAVEFERYWAEATRTFVAAKDSFTYAKSDDFNNLYSKIISGLKPEKSIQQYYKEAISLIEKSRMKYLPEYGLGDGLGLSLQEAPALSDKNTENLKDGMCVTLRLAVQDQQMGAVMIGNTLYLSKDNPVILTK